MHRLASMAALVAALTACGSNGNGPDDPVCPTECVDDDPCTIDSCHQEVCVFLPSGNCMRMACNSHQITAPDELASEGFLGDGARDIKLAVKVGAGEPVDCTAMGCPDADPCCNDCGADVIFESDGTVLDLSVIGTDSWTCAVNACGEDPSCEPVMAGLGYWVWGEIQPSLDGQGRPVLEVEDWCMQTTPETLVGSWSGAFVPGSIPAQDWLLMITAPEGAWQMSLGTLYGDEEPSYMDIVVPDQALKNAYVGDTDLGFDFVWCEDWGQEQPCTQDWEQNTGHVALKTGRDALTGTVFPFGSGSWQAPDTQGEREPVPDGAGVRAPIPFDETPIKFEKQ